MWMCVCVPIYAKATLLLPIAFRLLGNKLDAVDACVPDDSSSELSWALTTSATSPTVTPRGGAKTTRNAQQPRAVMLVWAEDKISREVPGLKMLTIRMLLKAEQRTFTAVLHSRSPVQTRQVLVAAYRRAGLNLDHAPREDLD